MKNSRHLGMTVLFVALVLVFAAGTARAQDPLKVAPEHYKVLLDNDHVRVLDYHASPGDKVGMHSHPGYIVYTISGSGKTKFTLPDGKTVDYTAAPGTATWRDAETHSSEYLGPGDVHVVLVEMKHRKHMMGEEKEKHEKKEMKEKKEM